MIKIKFILIIGLIFAGTVSAAYVYDPNDFATEIIQYIEGYTTERDWVDPAHPHFNNPATALGRPTVDTTGENWKIPTNTIVPVVNVYPAFRFFEVVTIGEGGRLILKFNHQVRDDENNPHGIDFIVFGNAQQKTGTSFFWENKNPATFMVNSSDLVEEQAVVSVSQDGINWYTFDNGPYPDSFAPSFGRIYDTVNPDHSIGSWNLWWGHPTDPTLPLESALTADSFIGKSVAQISQLYGQSAGGTGFDLAESGLEWIQYVKIEGANGDTPEVDSVSDVSACGDWKHPFPVGDVTHDCIVNYEDIALLADFWLEHVSGPQNPAVIADIHLDSIVNFKDWALLSDNWLNCNWNCQ